MDPRDLIAAFGGPMQMAVKTGCHLSQIYRWRVHGFPPERWHQLVTLARAEGVPGVTFEALAATYYREVGAAAVPA